MVNKYIKYKKRLILLEYYFIVIVESYWINGNLQIFGERED